MVKLGFHYLFLLTFLSHDSHIYWSVFAECDTCPKHYDTTNLWSHSLLCCTFYIYLYAHLCCNTHMYILVGVVNGSSCICNSLFHLISAFLVSCFPVRSICPYKFQCKHFFHCFVTCQTCHKRLSGTCIVTLVTYDVLFIIFCHLIHVCSFSIFCLVKSQDFVCRYTITVDTFLLWFVRG